MQLNYIKLYCSGVYDDTGHREHDGKWITFDDDNVRYGLDLQRDEYIFTAICPFCNKDIVNTRRAF
jgi:hypothetical protein